MLNIRLLANFGLTYNGEPLTHVTSTPMQSLLAYLLLHRDTPQARRHLAYLLWPESTEAQAHTNLRRELHRLRYALPDVDNFLYVDAKSLLWRPNAPYSLDVADFEATCAQVDQATEAGDEASLRIALEKAVALYPGDLLPNCYDDWIMPERERLSQLFARLLERLIDLLEHQREYVLAIRHAQHLRRYDPLHEPTYRHLMRLYALNGDRARALRIYHTCVAALKRELGVDPSSATRETYESLMEMDHSSTRGLLRNSVPPTKVLHEGRMVGRQLEWESVQAAWQRTAAKGNQGQAYFVLLSGDAGIGKTRLVEELLDWANQQGIATARTSCYAVEGQLALAPVADWMRADVFHTPLLALDKIWLTEIARLLPGILVERPDLPHPTPLSESGQRLRLFKALAQVVLADSQPLLLVIDDVQWCDQETLEWIHYLLRCAPRRPLLLAGTARPEGMRMDHPLRMLMLNLFTTEQATAIEIGPLSPGATAELAAQVVGQNLDPDQAIHLFTETEGNPLFVVEMVRAQGLSGVTQGNGVKLSSNSTALGYPVDDNNIHRAFPLPSKIHAVIQSRLSQLSPQTRGLAELAATIGRTFTFPVLAQASASEDSAGYNAAGQSVDEETIVRGLDELLQQHIIREQESDAYDFSHDKLREVAYAGISRARQKLLHRRVAQALEIVHRSALDAVSGQIAAHYERAGMFQPALLHYQRAANVARRIYAIQEAKLLYSRAIEMGHKLATPPNDAQLLPLYEGRALICRSMTQLEEAIADFQIMRQMAHATGNLQKEGESLCQLAYTHWLTFAEDQMPFVEQYAQEATEHFAQTGDPRLLARSLTMLGAVDQVYRNLTDAGKKLEEALEISRHTQDREALVQALSFLCLQSYIQGNLQETGQYAQEGVTVAREVQDDFNELRMQSFLCQVQWSTGDYVQAFSLVQKVMAQAEERGNRFVQGRLLNTLGWFHHEFCDFSTAIAYNQRSVDMGQASGIDNVEISALVNLGYDYLAIGQLALALDYLDQTLARVEREGFGAHKWQWRMKIYLGLAEHAYQTGNQEQALHYVEAGLDEALAVSSQRYVAKGWALRGKILMQVGKTEAAGTDFQRALSLAEQFHSPSLSYPLAYALGQWHEAIGQKREAAQLYAKAKATTAQMASAVGDETLATIFLHSESVQLISESWSRTL
jgi:predicted ATPase